MKLFSIFFVLPVAPKRDINVKKVWVMYGCFLKPTFRDCGCSKSFYMMHDYFNNVLLCLLYHPVENYLSRAWI